MNKEDAKELIRDLFTLRTVWIDQGGGKWKVKRRFHPFLRSIFWVAAVIIGAGIYSGLNSPGNSEAVASSAPQSQPVQVVTARLPEAERPAPQVQPERQQVVIPISTRPKRAEIVLPSEQNPGTDRIITRPQTLKPQEAKPQEVKPRIRQARSGSDEGYRIDVNKSTYTLTLYRGSEPVKEYPIAVGRNPGDKKRVGDNRTPVGNFRIVSIENASSWSHDFRDGKGKIKGAYGPWFFRLDAKGWKGIGIHGTHDPDSRGTMATEGCIRLSNEDISELRQFARVNMPVTIREY
ncbi:MAG: L,D-transpeptidase family protein [Synergistaceae bacterium]|nr:L,D-transpeptidase family protein [Synergistaceae bacterium]